MNTQIHPTLKRRDINLSNWRFSPQSQWAFQNVSEIVPSVTIPCASKKAESPRLDLGQYANLMITTPIKGRMQFTEFLKYSHADSLLIMQDGKIIAEWYEEYTNPLSPHIVFSISKSITGLIAGILIKQGKISLSDTVDTYIPESVGSTYEKATLQNLLDMSISIDFDELYLDKNGAFERYRRAMMWNPVNPELPAEDLLSFLCTMPAGQHPHGAIHDYRSPNTDLMGVMLERAAGQRLPELVRDLLWQPMKAYSDASVTVDSIGTCRASAGFSTTTRDLARLGELMRLDGGGVLPNDWVTDIWQGGDKEMWLQGCQPELFPEGSYKHLWYNDGHGAISAIGIHGQWLWIDKEKGMTIVKLSSYPEPLDEDMDQEITAFMNCITSATL